MPDTTTSLSRSVCSSSNACTKQFNRIPLPQPGHGDVLVFYSDGLSEAESPAGEAFGEEKIIQSVERNRSQSAEVICAALRDDSEAFVGSTWRDDLTICVLKVL